VGFHARYPSSGYGTATAQLTITWRKILAFVVEILEATELSTKCVFCKRCEGKAGRIAGQMDGRIARFVQQIVWQINRSPYFWAGWLMHGISSYINSTVNPFIDLMADDTSNVRRFRANSVKTLVATKLAQIR
jgi:hypothetical protein